MLPEIKIEDFDYTLPKERIAFYPLDERDKSKLLVYKNGNLSSDSFKNIPNHLPSDSVIFLNNTRVIHARLHFIKSTGAVIEIFCLEPVKPIPEVQLALQSTGSATWKCLVGNSKKWKDGKLQIETRDHDLSLFAIREGIMGDHSLVRFSWEPADLTFAEVLEILGKTPLPPYIERKAETSDNNTYQTVYAQYDGSVAAPTAGLHFTDRVFHDLASKEISTAYLTLHVGAGTFKPVSSSNAGDHEMHAEEVHLSKSVITQLYDSVDRTRIVVGTTSTRTLESLYWQGVKWIENEPRIPVLDILQWDPYRERPKHAISLEQSISKVLEVMTKHKLEVLSGKTRLMIMPAYQYKVPDIMITNFHQPKSTLLLLIAAFIGNDWKKAYDFALDNNFRFLSYGDSCLFFKPDSQ